MTCEEYRQRQTNPMTLEQMTRAERAALRAHTQSCEVCYAWASEQLQQLIGRLPPELAAAAYLVAGTQLVLDQQDPEVREVLGDKP